MSLTVAPTGLGNSCLTPEKIPARIFPVQNQGRDSTHERPQPKIQNSGVRPPRQDKTREIVCLPCLVPSLFRPSGRCKGTHTHTPLFPASSCFKGLTNSAERADARTHTPPPSPCFFFFKLLDQRREQMRSARLTCTSVCSCPRAAVMRSSSLDPCTAATAAVSLGSSYAACPMAASMMCW